MKKFSYLIPSAKIVSFMIFILCLFLIQQSYQIGYTLGLEQSRINMGQSYQSYTVHSNPKCSWDFINNTCKGAVHD